MLCVATLFTIFTFIANEESKKILMNVLTSLSWFLLGLIYVAADSNFPEIAYLFLAIGIIFTVNTVIASTRMIKEGKAWK